MAARRGSGGNVRTIAWCKVNHHLGSSLFVPTGRGSTTVARAQATLALCQKQLRWQVSSALKSGEGKDLWIAMVGTSNVAPSFKHFPFHKPAEWKELAANKLLAVARCKELKSPGEARSGFSRNRPDTGRSCCGAYDQSCVPVAGLLSSKDKTLGFPRRFARRAKPSTLKAPVLVSDCFRQWGLDDQVAFACCLCLAFLLNLALTGQDRSGQMCPPFLARALNFCASHGGSIAEGRQVSNHGCLQVNKQHHRQPGLSTLTPSVREKWSCGLASFIGHRVNRHFAEHGEQHASKALSQKR